MISGAGLCWQHVGGVGSTTTTTGAWRLWCRSEEFIRKNVISVLSGEGIMRVKYIV